MKLFGFVALLTIALATPVYPAEPTTITMPPITDYRTHTPLNEGWSFHKGAIPTTQAIAPTEPADVSWEKVSIPHTWNAKDGQDGGGNYFRGDGWYRKTQNLQPKPDKKYFIRFEGANRRAELFVNGQLVGNHVGGNSAFVFDVTPLLKSGDNQFVVHVDNKNNPDSPPLQADFTFSGGLYRSVELIDTPLVHIETNDYASSGVYLTTPEISETSTTVNAKTRVRNDSNQDQRLIAQIRLFDKNNTNVGTTSSIIDIKKGESLPVELQTRIENPHLWQGVEDPYLYKAQVILIDVATPVDVVTQPLGVRSFKMDPEKGFILNGKPYRLLGVNRHQERRDQGWALTDKDHEEDMAAILEMGCTSIRLAHYQHAEKFYQLCDEKGLVVWAEIPVVDRLGSTQAFTDNAKQQYIELIRQNYNHPSICFWSAGNEVDENGGNFNRQGPAVYPWFKEMAALGKKEDPTRLTVAAWREKFFPPADTTDVFGLNVYLGWYNDAYTDLPKYIENHHANNGRGNAKGLWSMSEYGAGASPFFHAETPAKMDHSEEYQCLYHEAYWKVLKDHPEVWGLYIWNMFDFAVDSRNEGDRPGVNDKGLVTEDRKIKKDAFYFYQANWSKTPMLHITAKRFATRGVESIPVKVYSNADKVSLTVNGVSLAEKTGENGVFVWENVKLNEGVNKVTAKAGALTDSAEWTYKPGAPKTVKEMQK